MSACDLFFNLDDQNGALVCTNKNMTVLLKNLFTVHILIWHTQIRSQHYLWWQNSAFMDTARRSATSALLRRCCGEEQRWIYIPIRCPWMQFEQVPPNPPKQTQPIVVLCHHTSLIYKGTTVVWVSLVDLFGSRSRTIGMHIPPLPRSFAHRVHSGTELYRMNMYRMDTVLWTCMICTTTRVQTCNKNYIWN